MLEPLSLAIPVPATYGVYGTRIATFHTSIRPDELKTLLGHDPRSAQWGRLPKELQVFYGYLQRKTNKQRREGTRDYIRHRIGPKSQVLGAFPNICIGTTHPLKFTAYKDKFPNSGIQPGVGVLEFSLAEGNKRVLLDGLSRVTGGLDLIDEGDKATAESFTYGLTIFAPREGELGLEELGQLFHDFNFLATPVSSAQAIDLDQSDIHIVATRKLAERDVIKDHGKMEPRSSSLGKKSTALVAQNVLLRFVRGATEGPEWQHTLRKVPGEHARLTHENFDVIVDEVERFLTEIADRMGADRFEDRESLHLTAPGWNAMGVICHDMTVRLDGKLTQFEEGAIYDRIAGIDWSRFNKEWIGYLGDEEADENGNGLGRLGRMFGGYRAITELVKYIRQKTGLAEHLSKLESVGAAQEKSVEVVTA